MSKLRYVPSAVLTAALLFAGTASAQTWYDTREAYQRDQIRDGRADGSLTRQEYRHLQNGMQRIERYENFAERDGHVSRRERATLDNMLDRQRSDIYRQTHDRQRADGRGWGGRDGHDGWGNGWRNSDWGRGHDNRGNHNGWDRGGWNHGDRDRDGRHNGWNQGNWNNGDRDRNGRHDGWNNGRNDGRNGFERREAHQDRRIENGMQNQQSRQIHDARRNERTAPVTGQRPTGGSQNWGNGGWRTQQAANTPATPRPTMMRASSPAPNATAGGGGRSRGGRR